MTGIIGNSGAILKFKFKKIEFLVHSLGHRVLTPITGSAQGPPPERMRSKFCSQCGDAITWGVPPREHSWRLICSPCGFVDYMNPKMVRPLACSVQREKEAGGGLKQAV